MYRTNVLFRGAAALTLAATLAACSTTDSNKVLGPQPAGANSIFQSYVALGNSITAGYQSGGINDSTQRQSYAYLLAQDMGTRFAYPSLAMPGCPPPYKNIFGQRIVGTSTTCALRTDNTATLNNVAVPGATSYDPTAWATPATNTLTSLFLSGTSQVSKALQANPTFATVWIGNNDVLGPATSGMLVYTSGPNIGQSNVTSLAQFQANYDLMIDSLVAGAPGLKGVLIGVAQVGALPYFTRGDTIFNNPTLQAQISAVAGTAVTVLANCATAAQGNSLIGLMPLISAIKAGQHPAVISCQANVPAAPVGDILVLDAAEQATIAARVTAYNNYIQQKAAAIGFAYFDPNVAFAQLIAAGAIPAHPNFGNLANLTGSGFGTYFSYDGVHPSAATHKLVANALVTAINAKYGTSLNPIP